MDPGTSVPKPPWRASAPEPHGEELPSKLPWCPPSSRGPLSAWPPGQPGLLEAVARQQRWRLGAGLCPGRGWCPVGGHQDTGPPLSPCSLERVPAPDLPPHQSEPASPFRDGGVAVSRAASMSRVHCTGRSPWETYMRCHLSLAAKNVRCYSTVRGKPKMQKR